MPSSHTPDGQTNPCPICGNEPSGPPGDAPCPRCGSLVWFSAAVSENEWFVDQVEPLDVATKDEAIRSLTCRLGDLGLVPPDISDEIVATIRDREDLGVAGAVGGIAIPHARHPAVRRTVGIVGYSTSGIDFNSLNNEPVKTVILVLSPTDQPVEHLRALEWISRTLRNALT